MKVLGLTGGIGMGKSQAGQLLQQRRIPVIDTDLLAREVVEPGAPALAEVQAQFGPGLLDESGRLRREKLARQVFADAAKRQQLEAILHPRIRQRWLAQLEPWRQSGQPLAVVIIPLLFETGAEQEFDAVLCVACSAPTQWRRLRGRGWSPEQIRQRLQAQWPIERKIAASDYLIWTEGDLGLHAAQLARVLRRWDAGFSFDAQA